MHFQAHNDIKKEVRAHIEQKKRDDEVGGCETGVIEDDASFFFSKTEGKAEEGEGWKAINRDNEGTNPIGVAQDGAALRRGRGRGSDGGVWAIRLGVDNLSQSNKKGWGGMI